jgi:hypothetical protein
VAVVAATFPGAIRSTSPSLCCSAFFLSRTAVCCPLLLITSLPRLSLSDFSIAFGLLLRLVVYYKYCVDCDDDNDAAAVGAAVAYVYGDRVDETLASRLYDGSQ